MVEKERIVERLFYDPRIHLDYGVPFQTIPYKEICSFVDDSPDACGYVLYKAYDLVEQEKEAGRPGAFVTLEYDEDYNNTVVRVWGWDD